MTARGPRLGESEYAQSAYAACLHGIADKNQQQSAACSIALLHGLKGDLVRALKWLLLASDPLLGIAADELDRRRADAARAVTKAEGFDHG